MHVHVISSMQMISILCLIYSSIAPNGMDHTFQWSFQGPYEPRGHADWLIQWCSGDWIGRWLNLCLSPMQITCHSCCYKYGNSLALSPGGSGLETKLEIASYFTHSIVESYGIRAIMQLLGPDLAVFVSLCAVPKANSASTLACIIRNFSLWQTKIP